MPAFLNTLRAVSRRGQWRFRQVLRALGPDGKVDLSDNGLIDFSTCSEVAMTVTPRGPSGHSRCYSWSGSVPAPVLSACLTAGTLVVSNPGIVEVLFPAGALLALPPGLYDVRLAVTIGPETAEIFDEPIEFA